jgi:peroxiredoxin
MSQILAPGTSAPEFTLRVTLDQGLSLSEFSGRPVIIAFYPADWSPVCGDQIRSTTKSARNFISMVQRSSAFQSTAPGATRHMEDTTISSSHWLPISIPRER